MLLLDTPVPRTEAETAEPNSAVQLAQWLEKQLAQPVHLTLTENRSTMLSCRTKGNELRLRLHRHFTEAPPIIWQALVAYLQTGDSTAGDLLNRFVETKPTATDPTRIIPGGRFFHLRTLYDNLNGLYFHKACRANITWGTASSRKRRSSIQLGCYVAKEQLIRIHPCLDQAFVPAQYISWIIFHEMLHEIFGIEGQGPHSIHTREFRAIETTYPDYEHCMQWEAENLPRLLRYKPCATPV